MQTDDYIQIQNLVHRYCDHLDRGDFLGMGAMFKHADVFLPGTGEWFRHEPEKLAAVYREWVRIYPDKTPRTRHVTTNLIIEADGEDKAWAQSYVVVFQSTPEFSLQPIVGGRNLDRFLKVDGKWQVSERTIETDMFGELKAHMLKELSGPAAV